MSSAEDGPGRLGDPGGSFQLDGLPPLDEDAERAVLGALFIYGEPRFVKALVGKGLTAEDFYWKRHGQVFSAIAALAERDSHIDPVTVTAELEHQLGRKVDAQRIEEFISYAPTAGGLKEYAEIVINLARWRRRREQVREMVAAVESRDAEAWERLSKEGNQAERKSRSDRSQPRLRIVVDGDTGEVIEKEQNCAGCAGFKDQLKGVEKDLRAWRTRYANLQREREKEDQEDAIWLVAQALFELWKRKSGHTRSPWSYKRFLECEPYVRKYPPRRVEQAIAGMIYDPYKKRRRNGTLYVKDWWEDLFYSHKVFENYANAAPLDWKPELRISSEPEKTGENKEQELEQAQEEAPQQIQLRLA